MRKKPLLSSATITLNRDDRELYITECTNCFTKLTGVMACPDKNVLKRLFGDDAEECYDDYVDFIDGRSSYKVHRYVTKDLWLYTTPYLIHSENEVTVTLMNISNHQKEMERLKLNALAYRSFLENSQGLAFQRLVEPFEHKVFTSGNYKEILGYDQAIGSDLKEWMKIVHPEDYKRVQEESDRLNEEEDYRNVIEYRVRKNNGEIAWIRSYDSSVRDEEGKYKVLQGLMFDITERKQMEIALKEANETIRRQNRQLEIMASTDPLTQLPLRKTAEAYISDLLQRQAIKPFTVMLVDIDHFKSINDDYGHLIGDKVLIEFGQLLKSGLRSDDRISRWGGEEFLIVLPETNEEEALKISNRLRKRVEDHPFKCDQSTLKVTFSAGLATYDIGKTQKSLFLEADATLYKSKEMGRNRISTLHMVS